MSDFLKKAKEKVTGAKDTISEGSGDLADKTKEKAKDAKDKSGDLADKTKEKAKDAKDTIAGDK